MTKDEFNDIKREVLFALRIYWGLLEGKEIDIVTGKPVD
jgi:hypothetical protein